MKPTSRRKQKQSNFIYWTWILTLPGMLGSLTLLLTSGMKPMSIILSASSSTKPSLDGTQSSSVEESPLSPLSQTQSIAFLLLYLSPRRPSHTASPASLPPLDPVFCLKQMHNEVNQWSKPVMDRADSGTHLDNPSWNLPSNSSIWKHLDIYFGKSTDLEIW